MLAGGSGRPPLRPPGWPGALSAMVVHPVLAKPLGSSAPGNEPAQRGCIFTGCIALPLLILVPECLAASMML